MNLNLIVAAHRLPTNQFGFDPKAFDRAELRAEKRRAVLLVAWSWIGTQISTIGEDLNVTTRMAVPGRPG